MRLAKIQQFMQQRNMPFDYYEEDGCGSINFTHKGLLYHIWEFSDPEMGCESNVRSCGRSEDYVGDYEQQILDILATW